MWVFEVEGKKMYYHLIPDLLQITPSERMIWRYSQLPPDEKIVDIRGRRALKK